MTTWKDYLEISKYQNMGESLQRQGVPQPPLEKPCAAEAILIDLPDPHGITLPKMNLVELIEKRESLRVYQDDPLSLQEFSFLLWATQGVKEISKQFTKRTVPSAGARHPFETYILVNRVEELKNGLYRYLALQHKLILVDDSVDISQKITEGCKMQKHVQNSALTFCWVADFQRMYWRYGERSLRYVMLDAGHVCQNLYLAAEAIHCGVCAIAAYDDDLMNAVLGVDGEAQFTAYIATLGRRA